MAKNVHGVQKKQWAKWNRVEQAAIGMNRLKRLIRRLGFSLEKRAGIMFVCYRDGSCQPASITESKMWRELAAGAGQRPLDPIVGRED